ncbi:Putative DNA-binding domain protein [Candidatus Anstonella stagnisolia]|nr:Putative DNA-binding domain protein [Candidatus Anstonella stagnisolia]
MEREELLGLIGTGEGYALDFKESIPSDLGKHICAFANAAGGKIILGVRDDGSIAGYSLSNADEAKINSFARNIEPSIRISIEKIGEFAIIHVPEGADKPYSSGGQFYLRIGSTSQQLKRDEIREFFRKERLVRFDDKPNTGFDFAEDFDKLKFKSFLSRAGITPLSGDKDTLKNLNLLDSGYLKNAGVLFFANSITKFFLNATVVCVLYEGTDKYQILDMKEFNSDILSNFENALIYLRSKLNTKLIINAERTNRLELPEKALREALINALVHRDYFSTGHVQVDIYADRVDISNPGGLVSGLKRKDLGKCSMPRNPLLMDLLLRIDKVEKIGSGIGRMRKAMRGYGLKVKFVADENWFFAVFPRVVPKTVEKPVEKSSEKTVEKIPLDYQETTQKTTQIESKSTRKVPEKYQKIIDEISKNPLASRKELAIALGESEETMQSRLRKLVKEGILKRIGPDKGGHWEVQDSAK